MNERRTDPANAEHDAVMSWLQNMELKDRKLAEARNGVGGTVFVASVIERMRQKAYIAFPNMEHEAIDSFIQKYVGPRV